MPAKVAVRGSRAPSSTAPSSSATKRDAPSASRAADAAAASTLSTVKAVRPAAATPKMNPDSASKSVVPSRTRPSAPTLTNASSSTASSSRVASSAQSSTSSQSTGATSKVLSRTSASALVKETWDESSILKALSIPKEYPRCLPQYVLLLLGVTCHDLDLDLEQSFKFPAVDRLSQTRSVYFAKQLVNAGLGCIGQLVSASWTSSSLTLSDDPGSTASTSMSSKSTMSSSKTLAIQSSLRQTQAVQAAVDTFRLACRFLLHTAAALSNAASVAKGKELEVETIILRTSSKIKALGFDNSADQDVWYLAKMIIGKTPKPLASGILHVPLQRSSVLTWSEACRTFLIELQSYSATFRLEQASTDSLTSILTELQHDLGPLEWQTRERKLTSDSRTLDRVAYSIERSISKSLQRLDTPNDLASLPLRAVALYFLVQVSDIDNDAFWERAARIGGACLKTEQGQGRDVLKAFLQVQLMFEELIVRATSVDASKTNGSGYTKFCEYWVSFAKKVNCSTGIDRATSAMDGKAAQTVPQDVPGAMDKIKSIENGLQKKWTDQEIVKLAASLTSAVLVLDEIVTNKAESKAQQKLEQATSLINSIGSWPASLSRATQFKLHRVLDRIARRAWIKFSSQGVNSKGLSKSEESPSLCIDDIAHACLSLFDSLYSLGEPTKAETASETLPDLESQLTDIVHGRRILANKDFSPAFKAGRDRALSELQHCQAMLMTEISSAMIKSSVISEQLRLLSSSFYNPAGILYNNSNYEDAAVFLHHAAECDLRSVQILAQLVAEESDASRRGALACDLDKRQEGVTKKLEFVAVALRLSGQKEAASSAYRKVFASLSTAVQQRLAESASHTSIDETLAKSENKGIASLVKSVVDLSVFDLPLDFGIEGAVDFTAWIVQDTNLGTPAKGVMLEHAAQLLESRSHLHGASKALASVQRALLSVYMAEDYPLRRARTLIKQLELEVLSQRLVLSQNEFDNLESEAHVCLAKERSCDAGLERFHAQYQCSLLLISAFAQRLRRPFEDPAVVVEKVESACNTIAVTWKMTDALTKRMGNPSARTANVTRRTPALCSSLTATPVARKLPSKRGAPTKPMATVQPVTPPASISKPDFVMLSPSTTSPRLAVQEAIASSFDRVDQFCRLLEIVQDAFSTLALTRCAVELLKVLRNVSKRAMQTDSGSEVFCRASADLAQAYLALGKVSRAAAVLHQAMSCWSTSKIVGDKPVLVSQDARFRCLMVRAEMMSQDGDMDGADTHFEEALKLTQAAVKGGRDIQSSLEKLKTRERQAMSYVVCARLQLSRGNLAGAIDSSTIAVRHLIRQSGTLSSISRRAQEAELESGVLTSDVQPQSELSDINQEFEQKKDAAEQRLPVFSSTVFSSFFWRSSKILMAAYLRLSELYGIRGSGLDAEVYAGECIDFASSMQFALPLAQALIHRGEVRLQLARTESGQEDLSRCLEVLQDTWIPEVIALSCVQGDCLTRIEQLGEALRSYTSGEATLQKLSAMFGDTESILASPLVKQRPSLTLAVKSRASSGLVDYVLPELRGKLLRRQAWIWQLMGQSEQGEAAISKASAMQDGLRSVEARVDQCVLEGRIALRRAREHLKGDHFFSMLPEAAISIPMVPSISMRALSSASYSNQAISEETVRTALNMLTPADVAFKEALMFGALSSHSLLIREAFASLAQVYTTQASLGKSIRRAANKAATLIDHASSVGARRNLLVSIPNKLKDRSDGEAQEWPMLRCAAPLAHGTRQVSVEHADDDLPSRLTKLEVNDASTHASDTRTSDSVSAYWQSVQVRHEQSHQDLEPGRNLLPRNWTVISISSIGCGSESLVLTRQEGGGGEDGCCAKEAVVYSLPLHRQSQREGGESDEDERLTLKAAQAKLVEIVRSSNDGIHGVRGVQGMEARRQWWTARHQLDDELRDLLQAIQDTWLGGFKGVFAEASTDIHAKAALRSRFEKIIRRACFPTANKRPNKLKMDDAVFECFAGLPAECTDDDLEDLVHYVMDALQFSGFQVAVDEVDLDETSMDLRAALDEHRGKRTQASPTKNTLPYVGLRDDGEVQDQHIFLVLDKETAVFPWESMPILRGRAVSRIPSMAFLQDRIQLAKVYHCRPGIVAADEPSVLQKGKQVSKSRARSPSKSGTRDDVDPEAAWKIALRNGKLFSLSKRKTFYLLNPGGDLVQSQERFEPWLKSRTANGSWKGIVGRQPIVNELPDALTESDLFLYFGHGGAEQFVRATRVRELSRCAVAMLWGCSSANLQDNGDFDRTGTPLNYMCAGSPAMVGNLWDMTDRELDSVCEGVFSRLGLMQASERVEVRKAARNLATDASGQLRATRDCKSMSLVRAVGESRDDCKLPYLTGAAAVVYGVPVYWADDDDDDDSVRR